MKLSELKINEKNPFPAEDISALVEKIEKYPKFLELRPIVYDPATMVILGGNKRYAALKQLGHKEIPDEWVKSADQLTEKEKRAFIFADNYNIGTWDFEVIDDGEAMEWDIETIEHNFNNYEIDINDFEDEMVLKLKYPENEFIAVKEALYKVGQTPEAAVWELLKEKNLISE